MLEVGEVSENLLFLEASGRHFGPHFAPLELIWAAFWSPGRPPGTILGTLAVQGAKIDDFWVPSGHLLGSILGTFGTSKRKRSQKNMKKSVSGSGPEKKHLTNRVWRGPKRHPIDKYHMFREVRWVALGVILGGFWGHFWTCFRHFGARDRN